MFGYATDETEECMPLTIVLAHKLNAKMAELRRNGTIAWLRPDSKTQVRFCIVAQQRCKQHHNSLCVKQLIVSALVFFQEIYLGASRQRRISSRRY